MNYRRCRRESILFTAGRGWIKLRGERRGEERAEGGGSGRVSFFGRATFASCHQERKQSVGSDRHQIRLGGLKEELRVSYSVLNLLVTCQLNI